MKKYILIKSKKASLNTKPGIYKISKSFPNKEICENYYRVDDKYGNGRGNY